jgi:hypothetical protein
VRLALLLLVALSLPAEGLVSRNNGLPVGQAVATAGTMKPTVAYGADIDDILDAQGRIRDVVHYSSGSAVRVTYTAPNTGSCVLSYGDSPVNFGDDTDITALSATSGTTSRDETITGLASATTYDYKIACAGGGSVFGRITTQ